MKRKKINEKSFETRLARLLDGALGRSGGRVETFEDAGVLTRNRGLVVKLGNGQRFQVEILEDRRW